MGRAKAEKKRETASHGDDTVLSLTRRGFLGAAGASVALAADSAPPEPQFLQHDTKSFTLEYDGAQWSLSTNRFDPDSFRKPVFSYDIGRDTTGLHIAISLDNAYLPGCGLAAAFTATLAATAKSINFPSGWKIDLKFDATGEQRSLDLKKWMTGAQTYSAPLGPRSPIGLPRGNTPGQAESAIQQPSDTTLSFDKTLSGTLQAPNAPMTFEVLARQRSLQTTFNLAKFTLLPPDSNGPQIRFLLCDPHESVRVNLGNMRQGLSVYADFFLPTIEVTCRRLSRLMRSQAIVSISGTDGVLGFKDPRTGISDIRIQFRGTPGLSLSFDTVKFATLTTLTGTVSTKPFGIDTPGWTAFVAGEHDGAQITQTFKYRDLDQFELKVNVCTVHVPIDQGATANIAFEQNTSLLHIGKSAPPKNSPQPYSKTLWIGPSTRVLHTGLDQARLRAVRSHDLFDMSFGFRNHVLTADESGPSITRGSSDRKSQVIFYFPPQHLLEEVSRPPDTLGARIDPLTMNDPRTMMERLCIARTRIAEPSRIVFEDSDDHPTPGPKSAEKLTIAYLSQWTSFLTVVNPRALPRTPTGATPQPALDAQLDTIGLCRLDSRDYARKRVKEFHQPPAPGETAIEAVYGLQFSPDARARWIQAPPERLNPDSGEVWSLRLNSQGTDVRALWARNLSIYGDGGALAFDSRNCPVQNTFIGSLNDNDRFQIAVQSSFFGLAALAREIQSASGAIIDDPQGMVFRPEGNFAWLGPNEGIVVARPFDKFDLKLSRSGTLNALWQGEPAAGDSTNPAGPFFSPAFTVERYLHRIQDGRDVYVEVLYKGFLLPFGHRAALLKRTERVSWPYRNNVSKTDPTGYLIQHLYVVCYKPEKRFGDPAEPYSSLDTPARKVRMVTVQSPDLYVPSSFPPGLNLPSDYSFDNHVTSACVPQPTDSSQRPLLSKKICVFWPTLLNKPADGTARDVLFDLDIDDDLETPSVTGDTPKKPAQCPALFVDNAAVHEPEVMSAVADYYNSLGIANSSELYKRTVMLGGATRRYAAENKSQQCSFPTESWVMGMRGIPKADSSGEETFGFQMDPLMEGRDQPPLFPFADYMRIAVESVNRLTGNAQQKIDVRYAGPYVRQGFDPAANPSEIYLEVLRPAIYLDASQDTRNTGGTATVNSQLSAISRRLGPVGGRLQQDAGGNTAAPSPSRTAAAGHVAAFSGRFDPLEYFGGALNEAKLLGAISLKDMLRVVQIAAAPQLVEKIGYQVKDAKGDLAGTMRTTLHSIAISPELDTILASLEGDRIADFHPEIVAAAHKADETKKQTAADTVNVAYPGDTDKEIQRLIELATCLYGDFSTLANTLRDAAENPVPPNVQVLLDKVRESLQQLRSFGSFTTTIVQNIQDAARQFCETALATGINEQIFGRSETSDDDNDPLNSNDTPPLTRPFPVRYGKAGNDNGKIIDAILRDPDDALPRLRDALFADTIGIPLTNAIRGLRNLECALAKDLNRVRWSRRTLTARVMEALRYGNASAYFPEIETAAADIIEIVSDAWQAEITQTDWDGWRTPISNAVAGATDRIDRALATLRCSMDTRFIDASAKAQSYRTKAKEILASQSNRDYSNYYDAIARAESYDIRARAAKAISDALQNPDTSSVQNMLKTQAVLVIDAAVQNAKQAAADMASQIATNLIERVVQAVTPCFEAGLRMLEANSAMVAPAIANFQVAVAVTVGVITKIDQIGQDIIKLDTDLAALRDLVTSPPIADTSQVMTSARQQIIGAVNGCAASGQRITILVDDYVRMLTTFPKMTPDTDPKAIAGILNPTGRILELRRRAIHTLVLFRKDFDAIPQSGLDALRQADADGAALAGQIDSKLDDLRRDILRLVNDVAAISGYADTKAQAPIGDAVGKLNLPELNALWAPAIARAGVLKQNADTVLADTTATFAQSSSDLAHNIQTFTDEMDSRIAGLITQSMLKADQLVAAPIRLAVAALGALLPVMQSLNATVLAAFVDVRKLLNDNPALAFILSDKLQDDINQQTVALTQEGDIFNTLLSDLSQQNTADLYAQLGTLWNNWRKNQGPASISALRMLRRVATSIAGGDLRSIVDPDQVADTILDKIKDLLPVRAQLSFDFDTELPDFPPGDPIFSINPDIEFMDGAPEPANDLEISSHVSIDLLTGARQVDAHGSIRPFDIHLLGDALDLVTISFSGARFSSNAETGSQFETHVSGIKLGSVLQFLNAFSSLSEGGDRNNGFFYRLSLFPPQAEVGFGYSRPFLPMGGLNFQNIAFSVVALLPFDNREAEFRFAFASAAKPFLVSAPPPTPYGGGGFVQIHSNARGVVAMEISIEFGAVFAIQFGPLEASGRLTAGIYLMNQASGARRLEGFVHFEGEGHIACFGVSSIIDIRTTQQNGNMSGSAKYTYTFSLGFSDISFSVIAQHTTTGGGSGSTGQSRNEPLPAHTDEGRLIFVRDIIPLDTPARLIQIADGSGEPEPQYFTITNRTPIKMDQWNRYSRYFAI